MKLGRLPGLQSSIWAGLCKAAGVDVVSLPACSPGQTDLALNYQLFNA